MLSQNSYIYLRPLWKGMLYIIATGYMQNLSKKSSEAFPVVPLPGLSKAVSISVSDEQLNQNVNTDVLSIHTFSLGKTY